MKLSLSLAYPIYPWLSVYYEPCTSNFYFGWRVYVVRFRIVIRNKRWSFKTLRGFVPFGKQSLLMTWEEAETLRSESNCYINMDRATVLK